MKRLLLILTGALTAMGALAQEQVMICHRQSDGSCEWTQAGDHDTNSDGVEIISPVQNPGGDDAAVIMDWQAVHLVADPAINAPGSCARRAEYARFRFQAAMATNDLNRLISTYNWRGLREAQAPALIERLTQIPVGGKWQRTAASSAFGEVSGEDALPVHWRWSDGAHVSYFQMKQVDGCWFVEFSEDPGDLIMVRRAPREVSSPEPGVFDF